MGFTIVVMAICPVLTTILLEIYIDCVELGIDVLGGISYNSSKLLIR